MGGPGSVGRLGENFACQGWDGGHNATTNWAMQVDTNNKHNIGTVSRLTANPGTECRWVLWRVSTTRSVCSNVAPTVCVTKSICGSKSSAACCRKSEVTKKSSEEEIKRTFNRRGARAIRLAARPPASSISPPNPQKHQNSPTRLPVVPNFHTRSKPSLPPSQVGFILYPSLCQRLLNSLNAELSPSRPALLAN